MIKGIAIVKSTANKSSCNSFGGSKRHIPVGEYGEGHECDKSSNDKFVKYAVLNLNNKNSQVYHAAFVYQ